MYRRTFEISDYLLGHFRLSSVDAIPSRESLAILVRVRAAGVVATQMASDLRLRVEGYWDCDTAPRIRKAPGTFKCLRRVARAILSVRPKCSHRCVSLKESPLKHVSSSSTGPEYQPSKPLWERNGFNINQGPLNGGVSNGGVSRSGLVLPFLSFFVLFRPFLSFLGLSRFFRDFPDLLANSPGIFPICPFRLSRPIKSTYEEQSRKGPRHNLDLSRKPGLETRWNPKYGCKGTVTTRFALIALLAWQYWFDSTLRKLFVHPKYGWNGTVSRVFPLIALIALGAFFHSTPGSAQKPPGLASPKEKFWRSGARHVY